MSSEGEEQESDVNVNENERQEEEEPATEEKHQEKVKPLDSISSESNKVQVDTEEKMKVRASDDAFGEESENKEDNDVDVSLLGRKRAKICSTEKKEEKDEERSTENEISDSNDSDSPNEGHYDFASSKNFEELGITLGKSNRIWESYQQTTSRQLGRISAPVFTRNVTGSANMIERFKLERNLECHNGCVNTLNFNGSGDLLASGSDDLEVVVWDWARGKKIFSYESGHVANVFQAKFMPNTGDSVMVTCARDGQIRVGYLSSLGVCQSNKRVAQHKAAAHKLSIEPGSPFMFLTCGEDGHVIQIDLREENSRRKLLCRADNRKIPLYTISINPAKLEEFAVGGQHHRCRIYDRRHLHTGANDNEEVLKEYCPHHLLENTDNFASVTCLMYSYDGSELLVSYNDEDIYLFDATSSSNSEFIHRYKGHRNNATVKGVNFYGTRSEFIVSGSDCGHIFLWDKETESVLQLLDGDEAGVVNCLEPHPHYPVLATSGLDHDVKIWTPTGDEPVDYENIKTVILDNERKREEERRRPPSSINDDLLWLMIDHMTRRRLDLPLLSDSDDTSDEDNSEPQVERLQCYTS